MAKKIEDRQRHDVPQQVLEEFAASARLLGLLQDNARMGGWVFGGAVDKLAATALLDAVAERMSELRASALATKDFSEVDTLKSDLSEAGVEVRITKAGVELLPGAGFDAEKLEALL
jgi:cysteinyl-tRNA synthetase